MVDLATSTVDQVCTEIMRAGWEVEFPPRDGPYILPTIAVVNTVGNTVGLGMTSSESDSSSPLGVRVLNHGESMRVDFWGPHGATKTWEAYQSKACNSALVFFASRIADRYLGMIAVLNRNFPEDVTAIDYTVRQNPSDPSFRAVSFSLTFIVPYISESSPADWTKPGFITTKIQKTIQIKGSIGDPGTSSGRTKIGEISLTDKIGDKPEEEMLHFSFGNKSEILAIIEKFAHAIEQLKAQREPKPEQPAQGKK